MIIAHISTFCVVFKRFFIKHNKKLCDIENLSIVNILGTIDDKIENNELIMNALEKYAKTLYKKWFVDFNFPDSTGDLYESEIGLIPKNWKVAQLKDIMNFDNGYAFKSEDLSKTEIQNSYNVFKMGCIKKGGGFITDGTKSWISKDKCVSLDKYILKKGDLLMSMTDMKGNISLLGHTALMNKDNVFIVNQRVGLLRSNNYKNTSYEYLYLLTNEFNYLEYLRGRSNSGVQVNLTSTAIKDSLIPLAPDNINLEFRKIVKPIFDDIFKKQIENEKLNELKQLYLKKFFK